MALKCKSTRGLLVDGMNASGLFGSDAPYRRFGGHCNGRLHRFILLSAVHVLILTGNRYSAITVVFRV